jgi:hypothetical protein
MNYAEKLSRDNAAVILVDFLDGFLPGLRTIDHLLLRKNAEALTRLSSLFKLPTIMLGEEGSFRGNFFREVTDHAGHAIRVERHTPSAWDEPAFQAALAVTGRKKIILGGISLDICTLLLTLDLLGRVRAVCRRRRLRIGYGAQPDCRNDANDPGRRRHGHRRVDRIGDHGRLADAGRRDGRPALSGEQLLGTATLSPHGGSERWIVSALSPSTDGPLCSARRLPRARS